MKVKIGALAAVVAWTLVAGTRARAESSGLALALEAQVNALESEQAELRGLSIAWPELIHRFYTQRGFQPVWDRPRAVQALLRPLGASYEDGLEPEDYYFTTLSTLAREMSAGGVGETALAEFDVLCTEALLRLGYHLVYGKVDASVFDPHWNTLVQAARGRFRHAQAAALGPGRRPSRERGAAGALSRTVAAGDPKSQGGGSSGSSGFVPALISAPSR